MNLGGRCSALRKPRWRAVFLGCGAVVGTVVVAFALLPLPAALDQPEFTPVLLDTHGVEITVLPTASARVQRPVALAAMGRWLPGMTVALEDRRFHQHHGIDWHSTAGSVLRNTRSGRVVGGASTITQQLIKLASGRTRRSWPAKLYEAAAAWKLERRWSKERILAEYLNRSHYGNRLIGPEAAARWYFGCPASELTLPQSIYLAGLPQAPTRFNPNRHPAAAAAKFRRSLRLLSDRADLPADQAARLAQAPPATGQHVPPPSHAPHFVQALLANPASASGIHHPAGARQGHSAPLACISTTLDLELQRTVEELTRSHLRTLHRGDIAGAAVVVLENSTGAVRALLGSPDFAASQINGALSPRSCGSTLKPFVYLRGIDSRQFTAATLLPDTPDAIREAYGDYDPQDYNRRYLGPVRVREALACSLNVPAVVALSQVGARRVFFDLERWGFRLPRGLDEYGAGFVLGNAEIRLLDLAAAYTSLARGGAVVGPAFLPKHRELGVRLASPEAAAIVTDILCDNDARTRAFGTHSPLALEQRVAVKTGTSSGFRDAWTVGFTRQHTVAVWIGNPDGRPMREGLAIRAAAPLWSAITRHMLRHDAPLPEVAETEGLHGTAVCRTTGLLPAETSPSTFREWFLSGTEPKTSAAAWFATDANGQPHLLLPASYAAWCRSGFNSIGATVPEAQHLAIAQPLEGSTFALDPALSAKQQMIELVCAGGLGKDVRWSVNGAALTAANDGRTYWQLAAGDWRIAAHAGEEETAVSIRVEAEP